MIARSQPVLGHTDPLLHPFLQAENETEAERHLSELIVQQVLPLAREIALFKLNSRFIAGQDCDSEDLCGDVVLQLLHRLRNLRTNPETQPILNLRGYVATVTYNSYTQALRTKYPERQKLKNRLRYILNHDARFAMWEHKDGVFVGGFAVWKDEGKPPQPARGDAASSEQKLTGELRELAAPDLLLSLFEIRGSPIDIEELVTIVARAWGIQDLKRVEVTRSSSDGEKEEDLWNNVRDGKPAVDAVVERRIFLAALWKEVCELRPLQRTALLLNLRDEYGQDMLPMFMLTGVASLTELAKSLDIDREEFAVLWEELPLEDSRIATRIGVSRQQVINLRKSARERLARRLAKMR